MTVSQCLYSPLLESVSDDSVDRVDGYPDEDQSDDVDSRCQSKVLADVKPSLWVDTCNQIIGRLLDWSDTINTYNQIT